MPARASFLRRAETQYQGGPEYGSSVVFWTDIFLVCVLGLVTVIFLPQAVGRLRARSDWGRGIFLRQTAAQEDVSSISDTHSGQSDEPFREKPRGRSEQPHVKSLATRFPTVTRILRLPLPVQGYHLGRSFIILLYFGVLLFAALYRDSVFKNPNREGFIVASQLPWLYILATKNNFIGLLVGYGYDRLNVFHRNVGRLVALAANIHAIGYIYKWVMQGTWTEKTKLTFVRWGLVALVSIDILFFFALGLIRQRYYNFFYISHSIALVVLLVAICLHQSFAIPYVIIAAAFYGVDHILRILKSRTPYAYLQPIPDLGTTLVRIPTLNAGWRAGQFVRLRIISRSMGLYGWAEAHPYTIANACEGGGADGMVFMVKKTGGWTRKLYDIAFAPTESEARSEARVRVIVEGPYGGPCFTTFSSFSGALFVAGGSGISFGLAATQEILQRVAQGTSNIRAVELVWTVNHARALGPLLPLFTALLEQSYKLPVKCSIQVFYTRAITMDDERKYPLDSDLPRGMTFAPGRPWIPHVLTEFVDRTLVALSQESNGAGPLRAHGVLAGACGPLSLSEDVRKAIEVVGKKERGAVGGIQLYEEAFHW